MNNKNNSTYKTLPMLFVKWLTVLFLTCFFIPISNAATVTITANWPAFPQENSVQIYDASNISAVTPVFNSSTAGYPSISYNLADNTTYTLRMFDSASDGWDGGGSITVSVDGSVITTEFGPPASSSTSTFTTPSPAVVVVVPSAAVDTDGDGVPNGADIDDDNAKKLQASVKEMIQMAIKMPRFGFSRYLRFGQTQLFCHFH